MFLSQKIKVNQQANNQHERYMLIALSQAHRQAGRTWPNPNVGAVIVKNEQVIATAATAQGGRPHAETIAIENAGKLAHGSTLYVTLEPCSHHGKTPPCAQAIIDSGISRVVVACRDINPVVSGSGIAMLKAAGIDVVENVCQPQALEVNRGFFSVMEKGRPFISLKIATSMDGKITVPNNRWLTGERARNYGQLLRTQHDAIITGSGTVLADDPLLTCRLSGLEKRSPVRVVLARGGNIPQSAQILKNQETTPTLLLTEDNLVAATNNLTQHGITSIMVEAGAKLTAAFLDAGLVDRVYWFRAPIVIGDSGLSISKHLGQIANLTLIEQITLGSDTLEIFSTKAFVPNLYTANNKIDFK